MVVKSLQNPDHVNLFRWIGRVPSRVGRSIKCALLTKSGVVFLGNVCSSNQPSATHPHFDKTAFSRISLNSEPRIVVKIFGKFMLPKRRFWKIEHSVACAFLNEFSMTSRPNRVLTPVKSTSKPHTQRCVRSSKIFVWGA